MSLHEAVREFVVARVESGSDRRLTVAGITDDFVRRQMESGAWANVPADQRAAQYVGVTQVVREKLRLVVPSQPDPSLTADQISLIPEHRLLNEFYSVKGEGDEEHYVRRDALTEDEMRQVTTRFRALSVHYDRHATALEKHWRRRNEVHTDAPANRDVVPLADRANTDEQGSELR